MLTVPTSNRTYPIWEQTYCQKPANFHDVKKHRNFRDNAIKRMTAGSIRLGNVVPNYINLYARFYTDVRFIIQFLSRMTNSGDTRAGASFDPMWAGSARLWRR